MSTNDVELDLLIARGLELQRDIAKLEERLEPIAAAAIALATAQRDSESSIKLIAPSGAARVIFAGETRIDPLRAKQLEQKIDEKTFKLLFAKTVKYRFAPGYAAFMAEKQKPALERLKKLIAATISYKAKRPSVKFLPPDGAADVAGDAGEAAATDDAA